MSTTDKSTVQSIVSEHLNKKGSTKKFVGTLYSDVEGLDKVLEYFADTYRGKADVIVALDGAGYILGSMLAREMNLPFVPAAKESRYNEFDDSFYRSSYINHRDEACSLVMRKECFSSSTRVLIVDNWVETGATIQAVLAMLEIAEANVAGIAVFGIDNNLRTNSLKKEIRITAVIEE